MNHILRILFYLEEYLFPSGCAVCGRTLIGSGETWYGLCRGCREELRIPEEKRCLVCGRPLVSEIGVCLPCRNGGNKHYDRVICLFPYTGKFKKLLSAYKFGKSRALGHFFKETLIQGFSCLPLDDLEGPVLTPVPPRPGKIKSTGWDQIEYLARLLAREYRKNRAESAAGRKRDASGRSSFPVERCLKRLPSKSQKELNREDRRTNLLGKILCAHAPREAVLFDDVFTTGATMDACAAALKGAGAEKVYGVCLFYD
jgi:predicted amidophosphoribosyltransferase